MLIRNATLQMSATERACMDVRVMNGCVWEMGAALVKGLYESEIDLCGDVLMPGRMLETPISAADEKALRLLCRKLYREGVELVRDCTKRLDEAAQTVKMLQMQPDGNMVLTDFAPAGETGEKA